MAKKTTKKRVHSGKSSARASKKVVRRQQGKKKSGSSAPTAKAGSGAKRWSDMVSWSHGMLSALLKDWPQDKWTFQNAPSDGHALWQMGHLAMTYAWVENSLVGTKPEFPERYNALFGFGSKPVDNPALYPSVAEVRSAMERGWERVAKITGAMKESDLAKAPAGDTGGMAKDKGEMVRLLVWHEGWHQGQLSSLRKALGLPGVLG